MVRKSEKHSVTLDDKLEHIDFGNLIIPNGETRLRSIFDFKTYEELFSFIQGCKIANSTLVFDNESLTILPEKSNMGQAASLVLYATLCEDDTAVKQYLNYVMKIGANGKREPTPCIVEQNKA